MYFLHFTFYYLQFDGSENQPEKYADQKVSKPVKPNPTNDGWFFIGRSFIDTRLSALGQNNRALNGKLISIDGKGGRETSINRV